MLHVTTSEVKQRLGQYITCALSEHVVIEKSGHPAVVMLSITEYERLQALGDAYWGGMAYQGFGRRFNGC